MRVLSLRPRVALAIYAHPDDADVAAGGTLALWAAQGCQVHLVVICEGDKGAHGASTVVTELVSTRLNEIEVAAHLLGIEEVHPLGRPDGTVTNDERLRSELVALVRQLRPEVVLAPDPTAVFFGGVYVNHRDHREAGWAVLDSVAPAAAMPLYFPEAGGAHQIDRLLLSGTHEPDVVIDIAASVDAKVQAVLAHASQTGDDKDAISDVVRSRAAQAGRPIGLRFAEAFRSVEFAD